MKKMFIGLVAIVAIITIAATVLVGNLDGIIKQAIETEGTEALGSKVSVADVVTKLTDGSAIINGLSIANPPGYKKANAIEIGSFSAKVDYENQLVEDVTINAPTINAEILGKMADIIKSRDLNNIRTNFNDLVDNIPASKETSDTSESGDTIITIKRFAVENAKVNLTADVLGDRSFPISNVVMTNLSGASSEISEQITEKLTNHITSEVKAYATREIRPLIAAALKDKLTEKANESIKDESGDKLGGKLKDLNLKFGK